MNGQRVLTALVFTDAVAFSTRVGQNEEQALREIQADFDLMREVAAAHDGRVLKSMGDGLLMTFDSAAQAVDAALEIQRRFGERGPEALQHRMGVHLCDAMLEENDAHGDGVNLAARLEAEASPGGICLSQTIYDIVKSRLPVQAKFLGERHLKNLVEPVNVFEIAPSNAPRGQRIPARSAARPRGSYATAGAIVFLGICILTFAAVQATKGPTEVGSAVVFKSPKPVAPAPTTRKDSSSEKTPAVERPTRNTPPVRTDEPTPVQKLPVVVPPAPKVPPASSPTPTDPKAATGPTVVTGGEAPPEPGLEKQARYVPVAVQATPQYREAAQRFAKSYDFKGMRDWLEDQEEFRDRPDYEVTLAKWERLDALMKRLESDLGGRDSGDALRVPFPLSHGTAQARVWSASEGKIEVRARNGNTRRFEMRELDPMAIRALAIASARERGDLKEVRSLLVTFDEQFGARYGETFRKFVRPGTDKGILPPNVSSPGVPDPKGGSERTDSEKGPSTTTG